jgi:Mg-chelatase subunit ChlD
MNLQFAQPSLLFLLWLAPALAVAALAMQRRQQRRLAAFLSADMQKKLVPPSSARRFVWQLTLLGAGLFLAIVAAARPQWGRRDEVVFQRGRDLLVALDVSRSMLARDVHPNRLQRAKYDILDIVAELQGDRVALLAFRGTASLLCPLTTDYAFFRTALDAAGVDSAPAGATDIGDAIGKALTAFENEQGAHKAIILISDGEDLGGKALDAARQAAERDIPVFTVGIGASTGARIPAGDSKGGYMVHDGQDVVTRLDNETLLEIARITRGAYVPIGTAGVATTTLGTLYQNHLRRIAAQDMEETLQRRHIERYQWFLAPAFALLLTVAFLSRGRLCASVPAAEVQEPAAPKRALKALVVLGLLGTLPGAAAAAATNAAPQTASATNAPAQVVPPGREGARLAQALYDDGKYAEAAAAYLQAAAAPRPLRSARSATTPPRPGTAPGSTRKPPRFCGS